MHYPAVKTLINSEIWQASVLAPEITAAAVSNLQDKYGVHIADILSAIYSIFFLSSYTHT